MPDRRREELAMTPEELAFWGGREEFERQQWAKDRGHCCWAGAVAWPDSCPWHPVVPLENVHRALALHREHLTATPSRPDGTAYRCECVGCQMARALLGEDE